MPDTSSSDAPENKPSNWTAVLVLTVVLGAVLISQTILRRDHPLQPPKPGEEIAAEGEVTLVIEAGEDDQPAGDADEPIVVDIRQGMTVFDVLAEAPEGFRGAVRSTGAGANAFVHAIRGVENEDADGRNWQYYVNGERGAVGAGVRELKDGDRVLWKFAPQE